MIGVAVFREKMKPIARRDQDFRPGQVASENEAPAPVAGNPESRASAPAAAPRERDVSDELARQEPDQAAKTLGRLGTGHGRNEASRVRVVNFERASETPAETVAIQYDRRENLVAMGVLPPTPRLTRREPEPFPGAMRFAPDPAR